MESNRINQSQVTGTQAYDSKSLASQEPLNTLEWLSAAAIAGTGVYASEVAIGATYLAAQGLAFTSALPIAARSAATPYGMAAVVGVVVGGLTASNKLGQAAGLDNSLGHYVGLEWVGNQLGRGAIAAFGPAEPESGFTKKANEILNSFGLD